MKIQAQIFWLLLGLIIISGCKKIPFDYRNKFIGDWEFKIHSNHFNLGTGYSNSESSTYLGYIEYGSNDDELFIKYSEAHSLTLKIDKENELSNFPDNLIYAKFVGNDKIQLFFRWEGLGGGSTLGIEGEKNNIESNLHTIKQPF